MANQPAEIDGVRSGASRHWEIDTSGDSALTWGHDLTVFLDVDTVGTDTVTLELSPDGVNWFAEGTYTADTVKTIPGAYAVRVAFSAASKAYIYGLNRR